MAENEYWSDNLWSTSRERSGIGDAMRELILESRNNWGLGDLDNDRPYRFTAEELQTLLAAVERMEDDSEQYRLTDEEFQVLATAVGRMERELTQDDLRMLADAFILEFPKVREHYSTAQIVEGWKRIAQEHRLGVLPRG